MALGRPSADAFLNWVRDQEYQRYYSGTRSRRPFSDAPGESRAIAWINFFTADMGKFLRNAAIFHYPGGAVQYYKDHGNGVIPQTALTLGTLSLPDERQLRFEPVESSIPSEDAKYVVDSSFALLSGNIEIYGWVQSPSPSDGSPYWLLVKDEKNRIVWIAANGITHDSNSVITQPQTDVSLVAPDRNYVDTDLSAILGD